MDLTSLLLIKMKKSRDKTATIALINVDVFRDMSRLFANGNVFEIMHNGRVILSVAVFI